MPLLRTVSVSSNSVDVVLTSSRDRDNVTFFQWDRIRDCLFALLAVGHVISRTFFFQI